MKQIFKTSLRQARRAVKRLQVTFAVATLAGSLIACQSPLTANAQSTGVTAPLAASNSPIFTGTKVVFDRYPNLSGKNPEISKLVRDLWVKDPEYKDYVSVFEGSPEFMLGLADLNGDNIPEIFARHSDDLDGFCTEQGICRLHIYTRTAKGLVEIGRLMSADPILISNQTTKGYKNFSMYGEDNKQHMYVWNGKTYRPK